MPITDIEVTQNLQFPSHLTPVQEVMDIHIPGIIDGIPNRNGFIWILSGSGGSGKTSLMLNFFKTKKKLYRGKFNNIFYICPMSSFLSVKDHPFAEHEKTYHELNAEVLENIFNRLSALKKKSSEDKEDKTPDYNCVIIDDMADALKDKTILRVLNTMLIKARHLNCAFIFTLQSYYYFPKILRKQITNITTFKPKNIEEWNSFTKELLNMKKDDALKLYDFIYDEPYAHLDVDTVSNLYYKNFNKLNFTYDKQIRQLK
jgi:hypothetical protein